MAAAVRRGCARIAGDQKGGGTGRSHSAGRYKSANGVSPLSSSSEEVGVSPLSSSSEEVGVSPSSSSSGRRSALFGGLLATSLLSQASWAPPSLATLGPESSWPLWLALPVAPYSRRKTIRTKVAPKVWTFDQSIGIYYVHVPIRMTVLAMESGGLFVYAPVAPTKECLNLLQPLIEEHGDVRFIVLPSVAVEHKVNAGPFARRFPNAEFYVASNQYAFPVNLPGSFLGFPSWTKTLPDSSDDMKGAAPAWGGELEHEVLRVKPGPGSDYQDAAFFHRPSKTLLVCDAVFAVTENPPPILESDPEYVRALLFHARDSAEEVPRDTQENRRKGWRRIILYANFFIPGAAKADLGLKPIAEALKQPGFPLGWGGWLPFEWRDTELKDFEQFSQGGRPNILPIIQIILARDPAAVFAWLDRMSAKGWDFQSVVPAHLDAPLDIGLKEFAATFDFAFGDKKNEVRSCDEDVEFLRKAEEGALNFSVYKTPYGTLSGKTGPCQLRA
ncbi:hypothetical protein A3770_01p09140 [Chloropicon primus]|uniref:DUF4336 domain-containing protein n=2 Tax=Chloropicon primus TaxID=1764295 RepID=A0A5B8MCY5_9CHLO|nr:hypothetical protein A3770_01p09140 [Chloropicon primus]|eukprot:QDZ18396.1 hypothetical protein A3770_01p09140 [Chloropicon primus]